MLVELRWQLVPALNIGVQLGCIIGMQNRQPCTHMASLPKKPLQTLRDSPPPLHCTDCHSNTSPLEVCLHCCTLYCQKCLGQHGQSQPSHLFRMTLTQFTIHCASCGGLLPDQFDYGDAVKDEAVLKMFRFLDYIRTLWDSLALHYHISAPNSVHRGLLNLGQTCFLNTVLQTLFSTIPLRNLYSHLQITKNRILSESKAICKDVEMYYDEVLQRREEEQWHVVGTKRKQDSKIGVPLKDCSLNYIFKQFLAEMEAPVKEPLNPKQLLDLICRSNPKYRKMQQQDAEQLLLLLLDSLSQGERVGMARHVQRYDKIEAILGPQKITPIQHIFGSYLLNQTGCSSCGQVTCAFDLVYNIPISITKEARKGEPPQMRRMPLQAKFSEQLAYPQECAIPPLVAPFFKRQTMTREANFYNCSKCASLRAIRQYYLVSPPQALLITIKRFGVNMTKRTDYVEFPDIIDLSGVCLSGPCKYRLYAVIVHEGSSTESGHYLCYVRGGSTWRKCSDAVVREASWAEVRGVQAYIVFYQQI